jgi:hypothetical protein
MDGPTAFASLLGCPGRDNRDADSAGKDSMRIWKQLAMSAAVLAGLILLFAPLPASAQSCALCYTQAAASGSRMIQALKSGIIILIAPPTLMTVGLVFVCYRKRNQTRDGDSEPEGEWNEDGVSGSTADRDW